MNKRNVSRFLTFLCIATVAMYFTACSNDDNPTDPQEYKGIPLLIVDTDVGSSTDDLFALEMAYHYANQGKCKLLGVVVDREGEHCAACTDVMNTYFGYGNVPIALVRNGVDNPTVFIDYKALPDYIMNSKTLLKPVRSKVACTFSLRPLI